MYFKECTYEEIGPKRVYNDNYAFIESFRNSDVQLAEIKGYTQKSAKVCCASLKSTLKHYNIMSIRVFVSNQKVYIEKI